MRAFFLFVAVFLFATQLVEGQSQSFSASPSSLNFTFAQGGSLPPHLTIQLTSTPSPAAFSVAVATTSGGNWLDVTPLSGSTPNQLTAQVDPFEASLTPGVYNATVTINQTLKIPATLTVTTALLPSSSSLSFMAQQGSAVSPASQTLTVNSGGAAPVSASASSTGNWLAITPGSGTTPATFTVSVSPGSLTQGTYAGTITLASSAAPTVTVNVALTVQPPLVITASPSTLNFVSTSAVPQPPPIAVSVFSNFPTTLFAAGMTTSGNPWLTVTQSSTTTPLTVMVSVAAGLSVQLHTGQVTLSATKGGPPVLTIPLNYIVTAPQVATLQVSPSTLTFGSSQGGVAIQQALAVDNAGGGTLTYTAQVSAQSGNGNWLTVQTPGGTVAAGSTGGVLFTVTPGSLTPGTYNGTITMTAGTQTATTLIILSVNPQGPTLLLSQTGLNFTAAQGQSPAPQSVAVVDTGSGALTWNVTTSTLSGGNWLSASPTSGTTQPVPSTPPTININVNSQSLAAGTYYGSVKVNTQVISVQTTVLPAGQTPSPSLSTSGLIFTAAAGGTNPAAQSVTINNALGYTATVSTDDGANWLSITQAVGSVGIQAALTTLTPGIRHGTITLGFTDGSTQSISVYSVTAPSGTAPQIISDSFHPDASGCGSVLVPQMTSLPANFSVTASQSVPLSITVVDDCGHLLTSASASITANFYDATKPPGPSSKVQAGLTLVPQGNGVWSGTFVPQTSVSQLEIVVAALAVVGTSPVVGQLTLNGSVKPSGGGAPGVMTGIFNAASYQPGNSVALGSFVSIFGTNLSDGSGAPGTTQLPTTYQGTQVFLGGVALPLQYAGPSQINALIPANVAVESIQPLVVQRDQTQGVPISVVIADSQPGIYTANQQGTGQGAVLTSDYSLDAPTGAYPGSHPATRGDYIQIFCTGLGAVNNPPASGAAAPNSPLSYTVSTVTASIGGVNAPVTFSGLAPGFIGLYQVNATVPSSAPVGGSVPLILSVGSAVSNTATIAVQ